MPHNMALEHASGYNYLAVFIFSIYSSSLFLLNVFTYNNLQT